MRSRKTHISKSNVSSQSSKGLPIEPIMPIKLSLMEETVLGIQIDSKKISTLCQAFVPFRENLFRVRNMVEHEQVEENIESHTILHLHIKHIRVHRLGLRPVKWND